MVRFLGRVVVRLFAAIGFVALLAVFGAGVVIWKLASHQPSLPDAIILSADFSRNLVDGPGEGELSRLLLGRKRTLRDVVEALERGGGDPRVKGLYVRLGDDSLGLGKTQELRDAIHAFRSKGKFAIAFAETFGELGPGTRPYYLASAFDEVWLQPMGAVGLTGLRSEIPFFRDALDRLGITADIEHRSEYKTAANSLTETAMTPPQREETEALLASVSGQIVRGIAQDRQLPPAQVQALMDRGPLLADEAKDARLVDRIGYRDEALARAHERAGSGAELVRMPHYLETAGRPHRSGTAIALIYGTGMIVRGGSTRSLADNEEASAQEITRAFRAAFRDSEVRAILLRIDSPGGSAVASETIWREVLRARERGKPVIVSMGDLAASGGYYIAAPADKIVAQPATITGSIGVLGGKIVVAGLLQKLGVGVDSVQHGANAGMYSMTQDYSPQGKQRLDASLDQIYRGFKQHVATGRHLSADAVEAIAKGRVWSGEDAKERGLVDELGGYAVALRLAKEAAHIAPDAAVKLTVFPREKSTIDVLYERLVGNDDTDTTSSSSAIERVLAFTRAVLGQIDAAAGDAGVLRMRNVGEVR